MSKESIKQAVVLLETFTDNFKPFESNVCFLPFVNGKVSDYTFEWLGMSGVEEVILFSSNNENIQKSYAKQMAILQRFSVNHFVAKGCRSLGDVMRALDRHGIIRHNFILVSADVIGNVDCNRLFKKFEQIQTNDKGITMMMVYQNVGKDRSFKSIHKSQILSIFCIRVSILSPFHNPTKYIISASFFFFLNSAQNIRILSVLVNSHCYI